MSRPVVEWLKFNGGEEYLSGNPVKDLMDLLVEKTRTAGHLLTFKDASLDTGMFRLYHYTKYFVTFEKAAETAWRTVQSEKTEDNVKLKFEPQPVSKLTKPGHVIIKDDHPVVKKHDEDEYEKGGHKMRDYKRYKPGDIEAIVLEFYRKYGRLPEQKDTGTYRNLPSWSTLVKYLGPSRNWKRNFGLDTEEEIVAEATATPEESVVLEDSALSEDSATPEEPVTTEELVVAEALSTEPELAPDPKSEPEPIVELEALDPELVPEPEPAPTTPPPEELKISCEREESDSVTINLEITIPGRAKPISIILTV